MSSFQTSSKESEFLKLNVSLNIAVLSRVGFLEKYI